MTFEIYHGTNRLLCASVGAAMMTGGLLFATPAAADASGTVMVDTQRMSEPNLNSHQVGTYTKGTTLTLVCSTRGQNVQGYFSFNIPGGWDNLWYRTSDGSYVADVDIETGTLDAVATDCGSLTPEAEPAPVSSSRANSAVAWANSMVGSDGYDFMCGQFVANAYGKSALGYNNAISFYNALNGAGQITPGSNAPAGALVFSRSGDDLGNGHVVIARGDGTYVSGGVSKKYGTGHTVQVLNSANPSRGAEILGWANAPGDWPGR